MKIPRQPDVYHIDSLKNWPVQKEIKVRVFSDDDKKMVTRSYWVEARPVAHNAWSILYRWKIAWAVLIGKYDAVKWHEQE